MHRLRLEKSRGSTKRNPRTRYVHVPSISNDEKLKDIDVAVLQTQLHINRLWGTAVMGQNAAEYTPYEESALLPSF